MTEPVALESITACLQGVIPSPLATCSPDGVPNITYMSIVQYVDSDRIALSRQFFNKTRANLDANPFAQAVVVDPQTVDQYALDLEYLHTETSGPVFDAMRANLEAIASQTGMGAVFRLRGVDIHRVLRCAPLAGSAEARPQAAPRDLLAPLDEFGRRLASCRDYGEATHAALQALDDLFGFAHSTLLVRDPGADMLFATASNGYPQSAAGAEWPVGTGVIGTAVSTSQVITVPNLARSRVMGAAVQSRAGGEAAPEREIPLPGLQGALSLAAVPLEFESSVTGVLQLESAQVGAFGPHNERLLRILGRQIAAALSGLGPEHDERSAASAGADRAAAGAEAGEPVAATYYHADDSVFLDGAYAIKGAAGRILWKMLRERAETGRARFTNRELRLDESLGLPAGADNLEARLLVLRRRLADDRFPVALERVGRGRLELRAARPLQLSEVSTSGPMSAAHGDLPG